MEIMVQRNIDEVQSDRYDGLGGLAELTHRYKHGVISLSEIAKTVGYSRETIRNDFIRYLGIEGYALLKDSRIKTNGASQPLNLSELIELLIKKLESKISKNKKKKISTLIKVLEQAEHLAIPIFATKGGGDSFRFFLSGERSIKIRVATVTGTQPEHRFGLHRFKVTPTISSYNFVVFALNENNCVTSYIFKSSEIAQVQSLALRFKWFDRKSRYDYSRNRWSLLKS